MVARQRNGVREFLPKKTVHAKARIHSESVKVRENEKVCVARLPLGGREEGEGAASMLVILHVALQWLLPTLPASAGN